jgi:hypothetical protein
MTDPLTDEARVQAQAKNELTARGTVIRVLESIEESAVAYGKAFPENFLRLREPGMSLVVVFDEHDQTVVFGVRDAAGQRHVCHAVCVDRNVEVFGRSLDAVLRGVLNAVPLDGKTPTSH